MSKCSYLGWSNWLATVPCGKDWEIDHCSNRSDGRRTTAMLHSTNRHKVKYCSMRIVCSHHVQTFLAEFTGRYQTNDIDGLHICQQKPSIRTPQATNHLRQRSDKPQECSAIMFSAITGTWLMSQFTISMSWVKQRSSRPYVIVAGRHKSQTFFVADTHRLYRCKSRACHLKRALSVTT